MCVCVARCLRLLQHGRLIVSEARVKQTPFAKNTRNRIRNTAVLPSCRLMHFVIFYGYPGRMAGCVANEAFNWGCYNAMESKRTPLLSNYLLPPPSCCLKFLYYYFIFIFFFLKSHEDCRAVTVRLTRTICDIQHILLHSYVNGGILILRLGSARQIQIQGHGYRCLLAQSHCHTPKFVAN